MSRVWKTTGSWTESGTDRRVERQENVGTGEVRYVGVRIIGLAVDRCECIEVLPRLGPLGPTEADEVSRAFDLLRGRPGF